MKKLHTSQYKCIIRHFADGDTLLIFHECDHCFSWQSSYLRLRGIESYELRSAEGEKAKGVAAALTEQFRWKTGELYLSKSGTDKFGRYIGDILIDGKFLTETIVGLGFGWFQEFKSSAKKRHESNLR